MKSESFPKTDGAPRYLADKRTCVLPVKLQPGRTHAIWLNSRQFGNLKHADGRAAVPYLLVSRTGRQAHVAASLRGCEKMGLAPS